MAKRRTRKQKETAAERFSYSLPDIEKAESKAKKPTRSKTTGSEQKRVRHSALYDYDTGLIRADLVKTVLVSLGVLAVELGTYYYLQFYGA